MNVAEALICQQLADAAEDSPVVDKKGGSLALNELTPEPCGPIHSLSVAIVKTVMKCTEDDLKEVVGQQRSLAGEWGYGQKRKPKTPRQRSEVEEQKDVFLGNDLGKFKMTQSLKAQDMTPGESILAVISTFAELSRVVD